MNCSDFELELRKLVETRQNKLTEIAAHHVESCGGCRAMWQDFRLLAIAIRSMVRIDAPASIAVSVLAELNSASSNPEFVNQISRTNRRGQWLIVIGAAASLLAAIGLGMMGSGSPLQVAKSSLTIQQPSHVEVGPSVAEVIEDLRAEYQELAAETRATARDLAGVIPSNVVATVWTANSMLSVESNGNTQSVGSDVNSTEAVSSIGRSFGDQLGQAFGFLRVAVPENVPRG